MAGKPETDKAENTPTTLRRGSRGDDVKKLQETLNAMGYDCGAADGIFGVKTEAAVRKFQQENVLPEDGIAGKNTLALLYNKEGKEEGTYKVVIGGLAYEAAAELASKYNGTLEKEG